MVTEQVGKKWSKEMEVSVQAKTFELTEHWLAVGNELKLLQGENKARDSKERVIRPELGGEVLNCVMILKLL